MKHRQQPFKFPLKTEQVSQYLLAHAITPTQPRVKIAQFLFATAQHISADDLLHQLQCQHIAIAKATIYNTLNLFVRKGLVHELFINANQVLYDSNTVPHHHFYNVDTDRLTDIAQQDVTVSQLPNIPSGTCIEEVSVLIRVRNAKES